MSFLFGESPSVKTNTNPTITAPQGGILTMLQSLLETGALPTGTTGLGVRGYSGQLNPMQPGQFAAPLDPLQSTSLAGLEQQALNAGNVQPLDQGGLMKALTDALNVTPPYVNAGQPVTAGSYGNANVSPQSVETSTSAPAIDATQAFRQGVVQPMTDDFLSRTLPAIAGRYGAGAGGAFSSDALHARQQAATDLERTLAQTGSQYNLAASQANQQAEIQTRQQALAAALSNQSTNLAGQQSNQAAWQGANQFDISSALQAALANKQADLTTNAQNIGAVQGNRADVLGALGTAGSVGQAGPNQAGSVIGNLLQTLSGGGVPWNVAQTQVQGQVQDFYKIQDQVQQRLADMIAAFLPQTLQTTSVAQGGSTGLLGGLLGGLGSLATPGAGGASALGNIFGAAGLGLFSDERLKENFEHVGEVEGFPLYRFRWRGEGGANDNIGFKAQEVERKRPGLVARLPGTDIRLVNYGKIISDALSAA